MCLCVCVGGGLMFGVLMGESASNVSALSQLADEMEINGCS